MNVKRWHLFWLIISFFVLLIVFIINYIIDPWGLNNSFVSSYNEIKLRDDERVAKFDLLKKNPDITSFIFGTSRATIIDPERIQQYTNERTLNLAFSAATMEEIQTYIDWILKNRTATSIFIALDMFSLSDDFVSNGVMPTELDTAKRLNLSQYFSSELLFFSLRTIKFNLQNKTETESPKFKYLSKGMRYYKEYFEIESDEDFKRYIEAKVSTPKAEWHTQNYSPKQVERFSKMLYLLKEKNIKVYLFVNPLMIEQILQGEAFVQQLQMTREIIDQNPDITLYDFNNINSVNSDHKFYINQLHYNYNVADCMIDKIFQDNSACAKDFGQKLQKTNIDSYIKEITKKWDSLKMGGPMIIKN